MDEKPNLHAWRMTGFTTAQMRSAANELREGITGVLTANKQRTKSDVRLHNAIQALAIAADHIDRLEQRTRPVIVNTSIAVDGESIFLFGVDDCGLLWQYSFGGEDIPAGWLPCNGNRVDYPLPDNITPIGKGARSK